MRQHSHMRPTRVTAESVERNIRAQRDLEAQRHDLAVCGKENANLISAAKAQSKIEMQRRLTQQTICKKEKEFEENLQRSQLEREFKQLTVHQNQALAAELDKDTADEERRQREIQKICEEAPELRELEQMLRIAYLNKERDAQLEERVLMATKEQERIQAMEDQMEFERMQAIRNEADRDKIKQMKYDDQRAVLQRQISEKQAARAMARKQIEEEKQMVDEVVNKLMAEDEADYRSRKEKQAATAAMIREYEEQRRREVAEARAAAKAEEDRIMAYNRAMDARNEGVAAKKQAKREEEDRILKQIVEETERKRKEEEEFNELRDLLWEEELEAKRAADVRHRQEYQERMRRDMMDANEKMMLAKDQIRRQEAEKEAQLVAMMRKKFAEDEARERAEEAFRRQNKMHHMEEIARQRDNRKAMYEQERQQEAAEREQNAEREEYRKRIIQEARKRLLEQHAANLAGYLPSKAFNNKEEYESFQRAVMH